MSKASSPSRISREMDHLYDPSFTKEINNRMRVPKRIKVDGGTEDDGTHNLHLTDSWKQQPEKVDMHVPDRILVIGQDQHFGTKRPPHELQLEDSVMPPDPGVVRVQTPPRVITLDEHFFPTAFDEYQSKNLSEPGSTEIVQPARKALDLTADPRPASLVQFRDSGEGMGMSTGEEVVHLRRQLAKLNRRVMTLELESLHQQHREKVLYAAITAYFLIKGLMWLNRS